MDASSSQISKSEPDQRQRLFDWDSTDLTLIAQSAELESTLARIKQQQDEQAYREVIDKTASSASASHNEAQEWLEVRRQISALVNIFFSAMGVATAIWWSLGEYAQLHVKMSASFIGSMAIVAIEAFLYARHFTRMKEKREWKDKARKGKLSFVSERQ